MQKLKAQAIHLDQLLKTGFGIYIESEDDGMEALYIEHYSIVKGIHKVRTILGIEELPGYEIYVTNVDGSESLVTTCTSDYKVLNKVFTDLMEFDTQNRIYSALVEVQRRSV